MELIKKAFECTFNEWYDVESLGVTRHHETDWIHSMVIYAETSGKAKLQYLHYLEEVDKTFIDVKARRRKGMDLVSRPQHPMLDSISQEQQRKMLHAVGYDERRVESVGYRNYFQCKSDDDWDALVLLGLAEKTQSTTGMPYYFLTDLGREVIWSRIPIQRNQLEIVEA